MEKDIWLKNDADLTDILTRNKKNTSAKMRLRYDPDLVNDSIQRWNSYSEAEQEAILAEGGQVYDDLADTIDAGKSPDDADVQAILERWHEHLTHFYEPSLELLQGLGDMYNTDTRFIKNFQKIHADLPAFLQQSITLYVDELETRAIEQMLAEDEEHMTNRANRLSL